MLYPENNLVSDVFFHNVYFFKKLAESLDVRDLYILALYNYLKKVKIVEETVGN